MATSGARLSLVEAERAAALARIDLRSAAVGVAASRLQSRALAALRSHVEAYLAACEAGGVAPARLEQAVCDAAAALPLATSRAHVLQGLALALQQYRSARAALTRARARHASAVRRSGG